MGELDVSGLMSVAEAIGVIDSAAVEMRTERVSLATSQGYSLAEDVAADRDYPPFDKSLMDGFAVGGAQLEAKIVGEIAAGGWPDRSINNGEGVAIMTGAAVPEGTYGVVPVEKAEVLGQVVRFAEAPTRGQHIAKRGADVEVGETVLRVGQKLEAAQLAVAASVGKNSLLVYARPRVGVMSTGDEIVQAGATPSAGQIRNSNSIMLASLLRRMDCHVLDMGQVQDDRREIARRISMAMAGVDVLLISGGMSMGKYDFVPPVLKELGVELLITKVRIKPGKPFVFGRKKRVGGDCFVFGLPGNPVSAMICTLRLASRLMRRMQGRTPEPEWIEGKLLADLRENGNREFYQPVRREAAGVMPLTWKGSADIFTLAQADGLLPRAEHAPAIAAGQMVRVMAIG